ncbi:uncharacterized protein [Penaeus vannamei]|uniref:uncharacterized protein n=1 Tax=Penaeus vannamei TaxID=6689 RepID=UPI00387F95D3
MASLSPRSGGPHPGPAFDPGPHLGLPFRCRHAGLCQVRRQGYGAQDEVMTTQSPEVLEAGDVGRGDTCRHHRRPKPPSHTRHRRPPTRIAYSQNELSGSVTRQRSSQGRVNEAFFTCGSGGRRFREAPTRRGSLPRLLPPPHLGAPRWTSEEL